MNTNKFVLPCFIKSLKNYRLCYVGVKKVCMTSVNDQSETPRTIPGVREMLGAAARGRGDASAVCQWDADSHSTAFFLYFFYFKNITL